MNVYKGIELQLMWLKLKHACTSCTNVRAISETFRLIKSTGSKVDTEKLQMRKIVQKLMSRYPS